ncbi:MAG: NBR1-Ig-like domain-containing protein, partial [Anaerolineales bacterium]
MTNNRWPIYIGLGGLFVFLAGGLAVTLLSILTGVNPLTWLPTQGAEETYSIRGSIWGERCMLDGDPQTDVDHCIYLPSEGRWSSNGTRQQDEPGLGSVIVRLGSGACPAAGSQGAVTDPQGMFEFSGLTAGDYCLTIDPGEQPNPQTMGSGTWTYPQRQTSSMQLTFQVGPGLPQVQTSLAWFSQPIWTPTPSFTPTETVPSTAIPTSTPACLNQAAFIADVTIADNTNLGLDTAFTKTWRIKNTGTCTWDSTYAVNFSGGQLLGAPYRVAFPGVVRPGQTVDLSVPMRSPDDAGIYRGYWMFSDAAGRQFGVGNSYPVTVQIVVGPAGYMVDGAWQARYYRNTSLDGNPIITQAEAVIDHDWGLTAPSANFPADRYSVRWQGSRHLLQGMYRFIVSVDDGVRVWVDGQLIIDSWTTGA